MQIRRLWRRGAALAGGFTVGFVCFYALRQPPYDQPRARRLQEWDGEKVRPDGTGVRPLRCFQGYQQIQGGGHWTQGAVVNNASLPSDGSHLDLADHALTPAMRPASSPPDELFFPPPPGEGAGGTTGVGGGGALTLYVSSRANLSVWRPGGFSSR